MDLESKQPARPLFPIGRDRGAWAVHDWASTPLAALLPARRCRVSAGSIDTDLGRTNSNAARWKKDSHSVKNVRRFAKTDHTGSVRVTPRNSGQGIR
jgi:hypothetical protein